MFEYIKGIISEITPTYIVIENNNIGYIINISLHTYTKLIGKNEGLVYLHQVIREDAHILYGFAERKEREVFRQLISVSGIGANTARMMLSSLTPDEVQMAIIRNDLMLLKSIKGIGLKTAERVIVDLRDKIGKTIGVEDKSIPQYNTIKEQSLNALINLGFSKPNVEKIINKLIAENSQTSVEDLIKAALKHL